MTAYELADKCNRLQGEIILGFLADCAAMLRQQQAEIESLKLRELTDREIMELYCATSDNDPLEFARAILKKTSEG